MRLRFLCRSRPGMGLPELVRGRNMTFLKIKSSRLTLMWCKTRCFFFSFNLHWLNRRRSQPRYLRRWSFLAGFDCLQKTITADDGKTITPSDIVVVVSHSPVVVAIREYFRGGPFSTRKSLVGFTLRNNNNIVPEPSQQIWEPGALTFFYVYKPTKIEIDGFFCFVKLVLRGPSYFVF